jgi:U3 small nucleolar RNA-associated protein 21
MDCLIKVWDLPSSKLIDCFKFDKAPTSICYSPTSEFFVTTHVNDLGVYLWSNKTLYSHVSFKQLPEDYEPAHLIAMPLTKSTGEAAGQDDDADENSRNNLLDDYKEYASPEQLDFDLISLSLLPESRWKNLVNLDIIRVSLLIIKCT